ncbi:MAG: sigma-70 family RNA polymerase sigma factor [Thermoanaerobaculia bacterium]
MPGEITRLLHAARDGDRAAFDSLVPHVYDTLRRIAGARVRAEGRENSLNPTALVHEAYLKLVGLDRIQWQSRAQFFAIAARAMRQILVDHALARQAQKRGGDRVRVTLDETLRAAGPRPQEILALEDALARLERQNERRARVVVCRFFGGMEVRETAEALEISQATVKREWAAARAWLNRELDPELSRDRNPNREDGA